MEKKKKKHWILFYKEISTESLQPPAGLDRWLWWVMLNINLLHIFFFPRKGSEWGKLLPFVENDIHVSKKECVCVCMLLLLPSQPPFVPVAKCWNVPIWNMTLFFWCKEKKQKTDKVSGIKIPSFFTFMLISPLLAMHGHLLLWDFRSEECWLQE